MASLASLFFQFTLVYSILLLLFFFLQKDTARELPAFDPQAIFSQPKKKHDQLLTPDHPAWLEGSGSAITAPSPSLVFRLAFADETYRYSVAILVLLLLIVLSLLFL